MTARFIHGVKPLQTNGKHRHLSPALIATLLAVLSLGLSTQAVGSDNYRAEFVILERIVNPDTINEQMSAKEVEPTPYTDSILWAAGPGGTPESTLRLVPRSQLHLNSAAARLERSGNYRVLLATGWYQSFPPNYQGKPLRVAIGDWLPGAGTREVEGTITIDRKRYLHVGVHLNHWREVPQPVELVPEPALNPVTQITLTPETAGSQMPAPLPAATTMTPELVTWIRETRRMRSEEIHYLDSPTLGVLIFFRKIAPQE